MGPMGFHDLIDLGLASVTGAYRVGVPKGVRWGSGLLAIGATAIGAVAMASPRRSQSRRQASREAEPESAMDRIGRIYYERWMALSDRPRLRSGEISKLFAVGREWIEIGASDREIGDALIDYAQKNKVPS